MGVKISRERFELITEVKNTNYSRLHRALCERNKPKGGRKEYITYRSLHRYLESEEMSEDVLRECCQILECTEDYLTGRPVPNINQFSDQDDKEDILKEYAIDSKGNIIRPYIWDAERTAYSEGADHLQKALELLSPVLKVPVIGDSGNSQIYSFAAYLDDLRELIFYSDYYPRLQSPESYQEWIDHQDSDPKDLIPDSWVYSEIYDRFINSFLLEDMESIQATKKETIEQLKTQR